MTKDEEDAIYQSCHEVVDGLLVVSGDRILSAIRAAYAKGREDERERCARVCDELFDPVSPDWREKRPDEALLEDRRNAGVRQCAAAIMEGK